jgi:hypothetical protein
MPVTNESIQLSLSTAKPYSLFILKPGPTRDQPEANVIQWEHVTYLFQLREAGMLNISCPVMEEGEIMGVGVLNTTIEKAKAILEEDPNVKAGRLVYSLHKCMGIPGDSLQ